MRSMGIDLEFCAKQGHFATAANFLAILSHAEHILRNSLSTVLVVIKYLSSHYADISLNNSINTLLIYPSLLYRVYKTC